MITSYSCSSRTSSLVSLPLHQKQGSHVRLTETMYVILENTEYYSNFVRRIGFAMSPYLKIFENMKKILFLSAFFLLCVQALSAQDIVTMRTGEDVKVLEVNPWDVKYTLFDEPYGPVYTVPKSQIIMIRYESGRNEVFGARPSTGYYRYDSGREPVAGIVPGMKYKELKNIYDYNEWRPGYGDRYNPGLMGVCSWFIPGLGQMISGEVGRGFGWLGGAVGCSVLGSIGIAVESAAYSDYDGHHNEAQATVGTIIALAGYLGVIAVDICAIVDACRVAKVRNMYDQDMRNMNWSLEMRPSVDYIRMADRVQPTAGLTLAMKF